MPSNEHVTIFSPSVVGRKDQACYRNNESENVAKIDILRRTLLTFNYQKYNTQNSVLEGQCKSIFQNQCQLWPSMNLPAFQTLDVHIFFRDLRVSFCKLWSASRTVLQVLSEVHPVTPWHLPRVSVELHCRNCFKQLGIFQRSLACVNGVLPCPRVVRSYYKQVGHDNSMQGVP